MKSERFERWLKNIYNTQDHEISCSECFDLVSTYVDLEISGAKPADKMSQVEHHLGQCAACREEYEALRDLRQLEARGGEKSVDDLRGLIL